MDPLGRVDRSQPSSSGLPRKRAPHGPKHDAVILLYAGYNIPTRTGINSSSRTLSRARQLASLTQRARFGLFVQGYEFPPEQRWKTSRYLISGGKVRDETGRIKGTRLVFDNPNNPKLLIGREKTSGAETNLFTEATFRHFLASAMRAFPSVRTRILWVKAHGRQLQGVSGEAKVDGKIRSNVMEALKLRQIRDALAALPEAARPNLLLFDGCLMGGYEVAASLTPLVPNIVASPAPLWLPNHEVETLPLRPIVEALLANTGLLPAQVGKLILDIATRNANRVAQETHCLPVQTLAAYSREEVAQVSTLLARLGGRLAEGLRNPLLRERILQSGDQATRYSSNLVDLRSFVSGLAGREVLQALGIPTLADDLEEAWKKSAAMVRSYGGSPDFSKVGPYSIFLPTLPDPAKMRAAVRDRMSSGKGAVNLLAALHTLASGDWCAYDVAEIKKAVHEYYPKLFSQYADPEGILSRLDACQSDFKALFDASGKLHQWPEKALDVRIIARRLCKSLEGLDFRHYSPRYAPVKERAATRYAADYGRNLQEQAALLDPLPEIPSEWKTFVRQFAEALSEHELPGRLRKLEY